MRVISKFQDYYDGVQAHGVDKDLIYFRQTEDVGGPYSLPDRSENAEFHRLIGPHMADLRQAPRPEHKWRPKSARLITIYIAFFCGKPYLGLEFEYPDDDQEKYFSYGTSRKVFWNPDEAEKFAHSFEKEKVQGSLFGKETRQPYSDRFESSFAGFRAFDAVLQNMPEKRIIDTHINARSPVVLVSITQNRTDVIIDPVLKSISFARAKDPYTAYQELSMFLGGVMGSSGNEMVEIDNDTRIAKHGFDMKYGFRKRPQ